MKRTPLSLAITAIAFGGLFAAIAATGPDKPKEPKGAPAQQTQPANHSPSQPSQGESATSPLTTVRVQTISPASHQPQIVSHGEVTARYELDLSAEVSGQILALAESFRTGAVLPAGTELIQINDLKYQQALASAQSTEANAYVSLLQARQDVVQAKQEWSLAGIEGEPDPLLLRQPQLAAAEATYREAQASVEQAAYELAQTRISVPFDALVVSRYVSPGAQLQSGSAVASLMSMDQLEVSLPLSEAQWQWLAQDPAEIAVVLEDTETGQRWHTQADRFEWHRDGQSRQRNLVVALSPEPNNPLLPGTFVQASLTGEAQSALLAVPASSLAVDNYGQQVIWSVDGEQRLQKAEATVQFFNDDLAYIASDEPVDLVIAPGSRLREAQRVNRQSVQGGE
ncbi:efflux RND transporter periplasmic adaptor subunit [Ferrimonas pelagia]